MASASNELPETKQVTATGVVAFRRPRISDAAEIWRLAKVCPSLDLNSPYFYLLWCRDFFSTSVVAYIGTELVGFVTGYLCPADPATLMIWQVSVSPATRRRRIATTMINELVGCTPGISSIEATVTGNNLASRRLFLGLADRWQAPVHEEVLFLATAFPVPHQAEHLYRIGPINSDDKAAINGGF